MSNSFVKRAPEIAEEILLKVADSRLPGDLKAFSRSLLSKEASDDREKLVAPERMSLSELQKIAHENKVTLPSVTVTTVEDWADVASSLTKVASRHEAENARDIFENAAAMVATKEAARGAHVRAGVAGAVYAPQPQSLRKRIFGGKSVRMEHEQALAHHENAMARIPGTEQHARAADATAMKSKATEDAASAARHHDLKEKAITHTAPLMAAAVGVPMAAMAMRRDPAKKEEVKIYK